MEFIELAGTSPSFRSCDTRQITVTLLEKSPEFEMLNEVKLSFVKSRATTRSYCL